MIILGQLRKMTGLTVLPAEILTAIIKPFVDGLRYRGETDIFDLMRVSRFCRDTVLIAWYPEDTSRWSTDLWQRKAERMVQLEARALWDIEVKRIQTEMNELDPPKPFICRKGARPRQLTAEESERIAKRANIRRHLRQSFDAAVEAQQRLPAVRPKISSKELRDAYCEMISRICAKQGHITHRCDGTGYDPSNYASVQRQIDAQLTNLMSQSPSSGARPVLLPPEPDTST